MLPPSSPPALVCNSFCEDKTQAWDDKCTWGGCNGCSECSSSPECKPTTFLFMSAFDTRFGSYLMRAGHIAAEIDQMPHHKAMHLVSRFSEDSPPPDVVQLELVGAREFLDRSKSGGKISKDLSETREFLTPNQLVSSSGAIFCISIKSVDPAMARFCRESLNATYVLDLVDAPVDFDHNPLQATSPVHGLHLLFRRIVTGADHHHDPTAARDCGYYRDCGADAEAAETESTKLVSNVDVLLVVSETLQRRCEKYFNRFTGGRSMRILVALHHHTNYAPQLVRDPLCDVTTGPFEPSPGNGRLQVQRRTIATTGLPITSDESKGSFNRRTLVRRGLSLVGLEGYTEDNLAGVEELRRIFANASLSLRIIDHTAMSPHVMTNRAARVTGKTHGPGRL